MKRSLRVSQVGEEGLIERIKRSIRTDSGVIRGIGDDCAVLKGPSGRHLLFASDMLVERVHFLRSSPPEKVGWKALAVNVSDIAAMGGLPRHAVVSLGLPPQTPVAWVDRLYRGLRRCARRFGVNLVGGDTNRSDRLVIDVAILGEVEPSRVVYRAGARAGDWLLVTGRLGGAVRSGRHLTFIPRVREARALTQKGRLHAMIDLSDGLSADLSRLCRASGLGALLDASRVPRRRGVSLRAALTEGEDFELLMAAPPREARRLLRWAKWHLRCGLHEIGRVVPRRGGSVLPAGFRHF
ncbi:MAG: thiamine-phosphate kinase [Candidatus Omnitrophica bacterium]|nr:thiamine-phosphate kinase [Candidatus Omnitrophota bacterium]